MLNVRTSIVRARRARANIFPSAQVLFLFLLLPLAGCQAKVSSDSIRPVFELKLSEVEALREPSKIGDARVTELNFTASDRLALGSYFSSPPDPSAGQDFRGTVRSNAAIVILDAESGKTVASKTWSDLEGEPTVSGKLKILPVGKGNFIVGVQDTIFRFSPDFGVQAERRLRPKGAGKNNGLHEDYWSVSADAKGRSAMLIRSTSRLTEQGYWISPLTLSDVQQLDELPRYVHSIVALVDRTLVSNWNHLDVDPHPVMVEEPGTQPRALCTGCVGALASIFGKDLILLTARPGPSYVVVDLNGNVIYRQSHAGDRGALVVSSGAVDANRAAIRYFEGDLSRGGTLHFAVMDADAKKEIWRHERAMTPDKSDVGPFHVTSFTPPMIALSPDGHKLAILSNGVLQVYNIS